MYIRIARLILGERHNLEYQVFMLLFITKQQYNDAFITSEHTGNVMVQLFFFPSKGQGFSFRGNRIGKYIFKKSAFHSLSSINFSILQKTYLVVPNT